MLPPDPNDLFECFKFCSRRSDAAAVQCLQAMREHGMSLSELRDAQANTLLHFAASRGCRNAAEMLTRAGLRPEELNASAKSPLAIAQDFKGYGKPYRLTYEYMNLFSASFSGGEKLEEEAVAALGEFGEPEMIERALLKMIGLRLLSEYPGVGQVQAVIQCLEDPADPCSLLITVSDHGKIRKVSRAEACEQIELLVPVVQPSKPAPQRRPKVKRAAPTHTEGNHKKPKSFAQGVRLGKTEVATERECSELRLRLENAEARLKHSTRENAMLSQVRHRAISICTQSPQALTVAVENAPEPHFVVEEATTSKESEQTRSMEAKEDKRLKTSNVNIGRYFHPAEVTAPTRQLCDGLQAIHPLEFKGVDGFMLFQRILCRHKAESGRTLLEEMKEDLADVSDVVNGATPTCRICIDGCKGRYSRYVVQQANQSSQRRVCFAPEQTCQHPEVRHHTPPELP